VSLIRLFPKAKLDLSGIWDYTYQEWGLEQAEKYMQTLWQSMQGLIVDPSTSVDIGYVRKGYRKTRTGSHVIFFKLADDGINVVRILHQKMDFERHL
jgi:toxin ParE1/3/4